ncbi:MAG: hypothetical protein AUI14_23100 [Actinobacteria bacterium 13_2_20CM_2_71_6]|nr:MAG: hypothetical protein AUI14_23100 [Actinobacteria bacterium 13_2_20CM_2_71_6]
MKRRYAWAALLLLAPLAMSCSFGDIYNGCGDERPDGITMTDLFGTYAGPDAGTVTLRDDRTFVADGLRIKDKDQLAGHGTWAMRPAPTPPRTADDGEIVLTFVHDDGTTTDWTRIDVGGKAVEYGAGQRDLTLWLYYLYGDVESCDPRKLSKVDGPGPGGASGGPPGTSPS